MLSAGARRRGPAHPGAARIARRRAARPPRARCGRRGPGAASTRPARGREARGRPAMRASARASSAPLMPPATGVPTSGASSGVMTSRSMLTPKPRCRRWRCRPLRRSPRRCRGCAPRPCGSRARRGARGARPPRARSCARPTRQTCRGWSTPAGEAVERVVVLPEQPGERHAVQPAGVAGGRRVAVHVGVDPDQAERPAPLSVRATPVQVPPAQLWSPPMTQGRRPRRRASATAAPSWPHRRLTANCLRRSPGDGSRASARRARSRRRRARRCASRGTSTAGASAHPGSAPPRPHAAPISSICRCIAYIPYPQAATARFRTAATRCPSLSAAMLKGSGVDGGKMAGLGELHAGAVARRLALDRRVRGA